MGKGTAHAAFARWTGDATCGATGAHVADSGCAALLELIGRTKRILSQQPKDKNKLYALMHRKSNVWPRARRASPRSSA
jgi:hypothetical protein